MDSICTQKEALQKLEHFCAYQERCHDEVISKLYSLKMTSDEINNIVVQLIEGNFLNETRFACSFARGKHRIKFWGKIRITNELKARHISSTNITLALKEISPEEYETNFNNLSERYWESINEKNVLKKRKKFCDYLLRRGYESNLVYDKAKELELN
ncbi:RecX family transcriptional regulator [Flavobacterium sp. JLP]|uniref:regulatory protein RecX n=1 Tax=unclassified Flavobacterium TaxID=196869 RepID=UPI001889EFAC|nr:MULTISPECIES: regulatory protein RecX [unclassified Flavobacterium]MBF4494816.1 RecX family transcriptional regulator [Flavobacterium sp. MR2016-29]MBF4508827.1 RecX family transcriptional regulator [Flavobacterium sp. JLP]